LDVNNNEQLELGALVIIGGGLEFQTDKKSVSVDDLDGGVAEQSDVF